MPCNLKYSCNHWRITGGNCIGCGNNEDEKIFITTNNPYSDAEKRMKQMIGINFEFETEEMRDYILNDIKQHEATAKAIKDGARKILYPKIKDVIFNYPATIVFWTDGTKTVVKTSMLDPYDPEKGMAMAIAKKFMGNKGNYYNEFAKYLDKYNKQFAEEEPINLMPRD